MHSGLAVEAVINDSGDTNDPLTRLEASNAERQRLTFMQSMRKRNRRRSQHYIRCTAVDPALTLAFSTDLGNTTSVDVYGRTVTLKPDACDSKDRIKHSNIGLFVVTKKTLGYLIFKKFPHCSYVFCGMQRRQCELD